MSNLDQYQLLEELSKFKGQWFVVNCITGLEDKIKDDLLQKVKSQNLSNEIFDIRVSKSSVVSKTKKKTTEENKFPGYLFINMIMTDATWYVVRNTPGVTGFIGSSGKGTKPFPLTTEEVSKMILNADLKAEKAVNKANFKLGDYVLIKSGSFVNSQGKVVSIDENKGTTVVEVEFLGRITPVELTFDNIEGNS